MVYGTPKCAHACVVHIKLCVQLAFKKKNKKTFVPFKPLPLSLSDFKSRFHPNEPFFWVCFNQLKKPKLYYFSFFFKLPDFRSVSELQQDRPGRTIQQKKFDFKTSQSAKLEHPAFQSPNFTPCIQTKALTTNFEIWIFNLIY